MPRLATRPPVIERLEPVLCPICGVDDVKVIYPSRRASLVVRKHEFRPSGDTPLEDPLVRCRRCKMEYVNPRAPSDLVLDGYTMAPDDTFASQVAGRERTFARCLQKIQSVWRKTPGRLLDIGTASGSFLKVARDAGWQVDGCEPNHWLRAWCQHNYGISVKPGTLFDARFPSAAFDVITLFDVLEHVPDPLAVLEECDRLLAPGGLLVVNYPDIGAWISRLMGQRWVFLISVHNYYFTPRTIRAILAKIGMRPVLSKPHFQTLELDYILFRAEPLLGPVARACRGIAKRLGLSDAQVPYWIGQTLVVAERSAR